jgi:hypothetical protein
LGYENSLAAQFGHHLQNRQFLGLGLQINRHLQPQPAFREVSQVDINDKNLLFRAAAGAGGKSELVAAEGLKTPSTNPKSPKPASKNSSLPAPLLSDPVHNNILS